MLRVFLRVGFAPINRRVPMPVPSVKVRRLPSGSSFQPPTLYSTERLSCWNLGYPFSAVLVEATDSCPGTVSRRLSGIGVHPGDKRILFRQLCAQSLLLGPADAAPIHPQAQRFVADELDRSEGLVNRSALG